MPATREQLSAFEQGTAIASGASTNSAFPPLLASDHYPRVYSDSGTVLSKSKPVSEVLSDNGYRTGAIIASNPYLGKWAPHFESFWNDGMNDINPSENRNFELANQA